MGSSAKTKELVLKYFKAWQEPADFDEMASCMTNDVVFDAGLLKIEGAEALKSMVAHTASPWQDVVLLKSLFTESKAVLFYEGTDKKTGVRTRVAEFLDLVDSKISRTTVAIVPLDMS